MPISLLVRRSLTCPPLVVLWYCFAVVSLPVAWGTSPIFPKAHWETASPETSNLDRARLEAARDYALTGEGSGIVIHDGKRVIQWGDQQRKYDLKSSSKSIGMTAAGIALADGKVRLSDPATQHHPRFGTPPESNRETGWLDAITLEHLAMQTAGFDKPGGYQPLLFSPGSQWHYSDGGPNWLAECITLAMQRDVESLLFERVFEPIGIEPADLHWRKNAYREPTISGLKRCEFGSGVHANVDAMARLGYLYLHEGAWEGTQLLPADFCRLVGRTPKRDRDLPEHTSDYGNASQHYGLLWWNNNDGTLADVPRDAFWSWGLYDSLIVVIPSLNLVAARAGKSWARDEAAGHYAVLQPFLGNLVAAVRHEATTDDEFSAAPYPPSRHLGSLRWAPAESIVRLARGSDNWPLAWGDDDALYTAYGDGWGFEPKTETKLSMGFARVTGPPTQPVGTNIRTATGETQGQGAAGVKASGMLMIDGTLYLLARNSDNSRVAWSEDRGKTWHWESWRFEESFGCPCFLDFGRDYDGARDEYVYVYSQDSDSAYEAGDGVALARVRRDRIREREAYTFYSGSDAEGEPRWTADIKSRAPVFENQGQCYRMSVSFHRPSGRYLMCQTLPDSEHPQGPRFEGGFGIYDAPQPWGPWTTVFFTRHWDVGPGETAHVPPKWMDAEGKFLHLVFSGDDCFSVRRSSLQMRTDHAVAE